MKVVSVADGTALQAVYERCCGAWTLPVQFFLAVNREEGVLCMVNGNAG
ncbi:MAG: hypothetical protein H7836_05085 [Magnetococcus sp. YQC-3]